MCRARSAFALLLACASCTARSGEGEAARSGEAGVGGGGASTGGAGASSDTLPSATGGAGAPVTAEPAQLAGAGGDASGAGARGTSAPAEGGAPAAGSAATQPVAGSAGTGGDPLPVTCPSPALSAGDHDGSVQVDGRARTYVLHVPESYAGSAPVPLVFDFHGYGSSGRGQMGASGFRELSEEHGFVGVYPDGVGGSWHVNGCCGQAAQLKLDEVAALRAMLAEVSTQVCVDAERVYASGISQGGGMAHHVGCLAADAFAAIAPVSSDLRTEPCMPARPISELSVRGTADTLSAYEGGPVGPAGMQYQSIGAEATLERWRTIDACTGAPETTLELCQTYTSCAAGVEVTLCSIPGAGHVLYQNSAGFDVARAAWAMFERQVR